MDTDVEVVAPLDKYLCHKAFSGFEDLVHIPTGIMACEKDFPLFVEFLKYYDHANFLKEDGTYDLTTNVVIMTSIVKEYGFQPNGQYQTIEDFALYPREVFCPMEPGSRTFHKNENTTTIHWFSASWFTKEQKTQRDAWIKELRRDKLIHTPNRILLQLLGEQRYSKLKKC